MLTSAPAFAIRGKRRLCVSSSLASVAGFLVAGLLLAPAGCGPSVTPVPQTKAQAHLQTLSVLFGEYQQQNRGATPPDEAAFKAYVKKQPPERLMNNTADEIFVSPRDGQPYVVLYGIKVNPPMGNEPATVVAYEKTGTAGKRYIATGLGGVQEVDEAEFQKLVPKK